MRVITGKARGVQLKTPEGMQTRPTADRVKEALFSIINFDIPGAKVLDLFGGTGQLGIEALSRGAKEAVFVDSAKKSVDIIRQNLKSTNLEQNAKVCRLDWQSFLSMNTTKFDIVFLDPPYGKGILQDALGKVSTHMKDTGVIIAENPLNEEILSKYGDFALDRQYRYGKIKISTYRHEDFVK